MVGFDINGLIPARDPTGITARAAINLIEDFLSVCRQQNWHNSVMDSSQPASIKLFYCTIWLYV